MNATALLLCTLPLPCQGACGLRPPRAAGALCARFGDEVRGPLESELPDVRPSDRFRFPPAGVLEARIRFAERHLAWLDARAAALGPGWAAREREHREEFVRRLDLWREARGAAEADEGHAQACWLRDLRRGLGVAAYNAGALPELPPPGFFSRAD